MTDGTMSTVQLPPRVADDLAALERRAHRLRSRGFRVSIWAVGAAVATALAYGLAEWLAPSITLSEVHVPPELLARFSDKGGSSALPFETSSRSRLEGIAGSLSSVVTFLAVTAAVVGGAVAALTGKMQYAVTGMVFGIAGAMATMLLDTLIGFDGEPPISTSRSDRQTFLDFAGLVEYERLAPMLVAAKAPEHLADYVFAQVSLVRAQRDDKPLDAAAVERLRQQVRTVDGAVGGGWKSASEPVLHALESAAFGRAVTPAAQSYQADASRNADRVRGVGQIGFGIAVVMLLWGGGAAVVGQHMRARVDRLKPLLVAPKTEVQQRSLESSSEDQTT